MIARHQNSSVALQRVSEIFTKVCSNPPPEAMVYFTGEKTMYLYVYTVNPRISAALE